VPLGSSSIAFGDWMAMRGLDVRQQGLPHKPQAPSAWSVDPRLQTPADEVPLPTEEGQQQKQESVHAAALEPQQQASTPAAVPSDSQQPPAVRLGSAAAPQEQQEQQPAKLLRGTNGPVRIPLTDVGTTFNAQQQAPVLGKRPLRNE
jgi:hypothetical protein